MCEFMEESNCVIHSQLSWERRTNLPKKFINVCKLNELKIDAILSTQQFFFIVIESRRIRKYATGADR